MTTIGQLDDHSLPDCNCVWDDQCSVRGRGSFSAIRGRKAHFDVQFKDRRRVELTIEIKGPENTVCLERISPINGDPRRGSNFNGPFQLGGPRSDQKHLRTFIPCWYQVFSNRVSLYYIPLVTGVHKIRLFNQSAQIRGSPFTVYVEDEDTLPRSVTFTSVASETSRSSETAPRIFGLVEKNEPTSRSFPKSKSSGSLSSSLSTLTPRDDYDEIGWETLAHSGHQEIRCSASESSGQGSPEYDDVFRDNSEEEQEEDEEEDGKHEGDLSSSGDDDEPTRSEAYDLPVTGSLKAKFWTDSEDDEDYEGMMEVMQKYRQDHFEKHSLRVQALIDYWNKLAIKSPCSEAERCPGCSQLFLDSTNQQDESDSISLTVDGP